MTKRPTRRLTVRPIEPRIQPHTQPNAATRGRRLGIAAVPLRQGASPHGQDETGVPGSGVQGIQPGTLAPGRPLGWADQLPAVSGGRGAQPFSSSDTDDVMDDHHQAPAIKLIITRWRDGNYWLHVRLEPRDADCARSIADNYICCTVTYLDRDTRRAWEEKRDALTDEMRSNWNLGERWLNSAAVTDAIFLSAWTGLKKLWHHHQNRGLEVTVGALLDDGMRIYSACFDDIREIEKSILFSIDAIAQAIEVGIDFAKGSTAVYGPGAKRKAPKRNDDGGTPPSEWR